jgi:hypothetical protein
MRHNLDEFANTKNNAKLVTIVILSFSLIAVMATTTMIISPTAKFATPALAQGEQKFSAILTGQDEVPPKDTKATGTAQFTLASDGKTMKYTLDVKDIDKVTMAHIHQGKKGENGPVVVTLFKAQMPTGTTNGQLAQGDITADKLEGPLKGKQMSDLTKIIDDGNAYTNVHSKKNPKGEIRGQISK